MPARPRTTRGRPRSRRRPESDRFRRLMASPSDRRVARGPAPELPRMTLLEHLEELRRRIIWSLLALVGGALGAFSFSPAIVRFLAAPILRFLPPGSKLAYLGVTEPFLLYFKVSLLVGAFLAFPVILLQVWLFISPGLYPHERRWAGPFIFLGWFFFVLGGAFAFYVAFLKENRTRFGLPE